MLGRTKGTTSVATPEQIARIRELWGKPLTPEHREWIKKRGRRAPNQGVYSYPVLGEIEGISSTTVRSIVRREHAYTDPTPGLTRLQRLQAWVAKGDKVG